jgi:hypothetical protein
MAREAVKDIDAISQRLVEEGLLKFHLRGSFLPADGVNHKQRREHGLEW